MRMAEALVPGSQAEISIDRDGEGAISATLFLHAGSDSDACGVVTIATAAAFDEETLFARLHSAVSEHCRATMRDLLKAMNAS